MSWFNDHKTALSGAATIAIGVLSNPQALAAINPSLGLYATMATGSAPSKITASRLVTVPNGGMSIGAIRQRSTARSGFVRAECFGGRLSNSSVVNGRTTRRR